MSELVNLHWKPASSHGGKRLSPGSEHDQFLKPFSSSSSTFVDKLLRENPIPGVLATDSTIFSTSSAAPSLSVDVIKQYFARKQNTKFESSLHQSSSMVREEGKKSGLDRERVKLIALALGGTMGSRMNRRVLFRQYRDAIIRCDTSVVTTDVMCPLLQLLKSVNDEELEACLDFVRSEVSLSALPEAVVLEDFEEPDAFLFEMHKVPEIKVRLECMIFEQTFSDLFQLTVNSLNIIYAGLEAISHNLERITRIFQLILKTGNLLNEGSKIGSHQASFSLATLAKLAEVKSSVDPKFDILHFILSHVPADEATLFSDEEIARLKNASNLRCYRVRDEVKDLLDSITAVVEIVKHPISSAGAEDMFASRMSKFAEKIAGNAHWLTKYAFNVFASYKGLCQYFEDAKAVYPPPKEKTLEQFDIIELFAWFGGVVRAHEKEIKKKGLRTKIAAIASNPALLERKRDVIVAATPLVIPAVAPPVAVTAPLEQNSESVGYVGSSRSLLLPASNSEKSVPAFEAVGAAFSRNSSSRPSLTKEQLQSSLSNLGSPAAPPLVAIINRGTGKDLTASKPKLSPIITPIIDVMVTPVGSPPLSPQPERPKEPPRRQLSARDLGGTPIKPALTKRHLLITPGGGIRHSRPDIAVSVIPGVSHERKRSSGDKADETPNFFATRAYPSRNEDVFPNYAVLNSRQSLSNTISRVAMLLSPNKEEKKAARRQGHSLDPSEEVPEA